LPRRIVQKALDQLHCVLRNSIPSFEARFARTSG
jgi:hypothetical protein